MLEEQNKSDNVVVFDLQKDSFKNYLKFGAVILLSFMTLGYTIYLVDLASTSVHALIDSNAD